MRFAWFLLLLPACVGCMADDAYHYDAPPPPVSACAPPVANACSGGYRPANQSFVAPAAYSPQTAEPPR